MNIKLKNLKLIIFLFLVFSFVPLFTSASVLSEKLSGFILLQVEKNGEAWYVNPADQKKYFLSRPNNAFEIMRKFGVGITNQDLLKIKIGELKKFQNLTYSLEDSDNDGYSDEEEIKNSYNPYGEGGITFDVGFTSKHLGKIFLQVEKNGEAWYINPKDAKRYYLGRPSDAFSIMRELGLGITDFNLDLILEGRVDSQSASTSATEDQVLKQIMGAAAQAIISGNADEVLGYFTARMQKSIDYSMSNLNNEERFALGQILGGSEIISKKDNKAIFRNEVYYDGDYIPVEFVLINENDEWKIDNL